MLSVACQSFGPIADSEAECPRSCKSVGLEYRIESIKIGVIIESL